MTKDEALKLALETLESIQAVYPCETVGKRITAIKQALEQPVQEPVANHYVDGGHLVYPAAQRQWVGLTDEERNEIASVTFGREGALALYVEAIEAKLKEKNT